MSITTTVSNISQVPALILTICTKCTKYYLKGKGLRVNY